MGVTLIRAVGGRADEGGAFFSRGVEFDRTSAPKPPHPLSDKMTAAIISSSTARHHTERLIY